MTHYFSRIMKTDIGIRSDLLKNQGSAYQIHRDMWSMFNIEDGTPRPFIYSTPGGRYIYCVSKIPPIHTGNEWVIETKQYDPHLKEGDMFEFYLRANPTVTNSNTGKHQRHDVVMARKKQMRESGEEFDMQSIIWDSVSAWICRKGESNGFEPIKRSLRIHSYRREHANKSKDTKIVFSTVVIEGMLKVTDAERFRDALFNGIGSSKSFGCGMIMIKRP